jgi:L-lactate utilization protein LutB
MHIMSMKSLEKVIDQAHDSTINMGYRSHYHHDDPEAQQIMLLAA